MKKRIIISLFVLALLTTGCDSSSSSNSSGSNSGSNSGSGDGNYVSEEAPNNSITLPEGVTVSGLDGDLGMENIDPTVFANYNNCVTDCALNTSLTNDEQMSCMMDCLDVAGFADASGAFSVAISITNSGSSSEIVTINAGTVLTPDSSDYQPMMLIQDIDLTIARGDTEEFMLPVYCLAPSLSAPDETNGYTISGITTDSCLLNILDILATKDVDNFTYSDSSIVQDSIWNCVGGEYTNADTAALNAL